MILRQVWVIWGYEIGHFEGFGYKMRGFGWDLCGIGVQNRLKITWNWYSSGRGSN